jgi:hypothetical protein
LVKTVGKNEPPTAGVTGSTYEGIPW